MEIGLNELIYIYTHTHKEGGDEDEGMWWVEGDGTAYSGKMKSLKRLDIQFFFFFFWEREIVMSCS